MKLAFHPSPIVPKPPAFRHAFDRLAPALSQSKQAAFSPLCFQVFTNAFSPNPFPLISLQTARGYFQRVPSLFALLREKRKQQPPRFHTVPHSSKKSIPPKPFPFSGFHTLYKNNRGWGYPAQFTILLSDPTRGVTSLRNLTHRAFRETMQGLNEVKFWIWVFRAA